MNAIRSVITCSGLVVAVGAAAQSPLMRSDSVEVKRIGALATVQRLGVSARSSFDPQVALGNGKGCVFNIGDVSGAKQADGVAPLGQPVERRALGRTEYITLVDATPICVVR